MIFEIFVKITCVLGLAEKTNVFFCFLSRNKHEKIVHNKINALQHHFTEPAKQLTT